MKAAIQNEIDNELLLLKIKGVRISVATLPNFPTHPHKLNS